MRENTKWIMLITALAFVALMVFEWGMDMSGRSAGGMGEIGSVNGVPVMYEDYQATYRQLYDQAQAAQEDPLTSQENKDLEDAAFDQVVNRILIQQELERRGIEVSDEEIRQAARFSPPPEVRQLFQGEQGFDLQQYQAYITSSSADEQILQYIESYFRDAIPRAKLLRQISTGIYLTDQELWRRWRDQNETVTIRYSPLDPLARISDDEVTIDDREIRDYYEANQEEFEVPAQATVKAVVLSKVATAADSVASLRYAVELAEELRGGAAWDEVTARLAEDLSWDVQAADLGVLTRGQLPPALDTAAFGAPLNQPQLPVRSSVGYHILDVQDRWGQDSLQIRHIVVPIQRTDSSEIALLTMADSLEDLGEEMALDRAAAALGLQSQTAQITDEFAFIQGAGEVGEGAAWIFEEGAATGEVSPVFENREAFYALELVDRRPEGVLPFEQARETIRQMLLREKKLELAGTRGGEVVSEVRAGTPLAEAARAADLALRQAGPFARNDFVPGIGRQNAAVGVAFGLDVGEVSDVVTTENNAFIIEKVDHTPADSTQWLTQKDAQRRQVLNRMQQERLQQWIDAVRANAEIIDRRREVLQPLDEEAPLPQPGGFGF